MKKRYALTLTIALLLVFVSGQISAQTQDQVIKDIEIKGNEKVMSSEIFTVIDIEVGDDFDSERIKEDMQDIYDLGYFQDISVNFQNFEGGIKVIFNVVENPVIKKINIEGAEVYDREQIISWLGVNEGNILNVENLNTGLENVIKNYENDGYIVLNYADVNISDDGVLNVVIDLGHINEIKLKGNEKTKDYVILREVGLKEGQVLNINDVRTASRNIYRLNYFTDINPELKRINEEENEVDIVFNITEKKTGNFNFGGGYSSKDGWFGFVKVKESNLGGNGQTLGFNYQFGKNDYYNLNFQEPYLMGSETSMGFNIYNRYTDRNDYTEHSVGGNVTLGHDLYRDWRGSARYRIENTTVNALSDDYEDSSTRLRSLTLTVSKNTTNYPYNPTSGKNDSLSIEHAGNFFGGDAHFTKYNFDLRRYFPGFKEDHSWALRLKGGTSTGVLPVFEKYTLGGSESLRGYKLYSFTGSHSLLSQIEYRIQFMDNLTGVVFLDNGQTWAKDEAIKLHDLNTGYGLGIRVNSAIGQIRLDYGWDEQQRGKAHFSLGSTF